MAWSKAKSPDSKVACGHPPRHVRNANWFRSFSQCSTSICSPLNKVSKLIRPSLSPDSHRDIGLMRSLPIRPVPLWRVFSSGGTAEPVRINCAKSARWSTAVRMLSHKAGMVCHSSIRRGVAPSSKAEALRAIIRSL